MISEKSIFHHLIIVGAIVEKDEKILFVQEKQEKAYGLWNIPAGWLDLNEDVITGAKREFKEETGFDIEIDGIVGIYLMPKKSHTGLKVVFSGKITEGELKVPENELLDVRWLRPEEILSKPDSELRGIRKEIEDYISGKRYPLDLIKTITIPEKK
ncbi:MAG: NUDIX domain-containing protein [Candidatus Aenigmatarchaeota archaeon]